MATIKSYTDLEQSKKLTDILPLESADMCYNDGELTIGYRPLVAERDDYIPAWSLSALLDVLPNCTDIVKEEADTKNEKYMCTVGVKNDIISTFGNNPVDACVDMIIHLKCCDYDIS